MAKTTARVPRGRRRTGPTFIQRSREVSSEAKATYHNVTGAGRRGVLRQFFDLGRDDEEACGKALEKLVEMRLRKAGA